MNKVFEEQIQRYLVFRWLKKNYFSGLLVCLLAFGSGGLSYFFVFSGFDLVTILSQPLAEVSVILQLSYFVVFLLGISIPISIGSVRFFLVGLQGKKWKVKDLLFAFRFTHYWRGMFIEGVRHLLVITIVLVPVSAFIFLGARQSELNWFILFTVACVTPIYYKYRFTTYVFNQHPNLGFMKTFKSSANLTDGIKWRLFVVDLSFVALFFGGSHFFGLGSLLIAPYYEAFMARYYLDLLSDRPWVQTWR